MKLDNLYCVQESCNVYTGVQNSLELIETFEDCNKSQKLIFEGWCHFCHKDVCMSKNLDKHKLSCLGLHKFFARVVIKIYHEYHDVRCLLCKIYDQNFISMRALSSKCSCQFFTELQPCEFYFYSSQLNISEQNPIINAQFEFTKTSFIFFLKSICFCENFFNLYVSFFSAVFLGHIFLKKNKKKKFQSTYKPGKKKSFIVATNTIIFF